MRFSVVINTLNRASSLRETLESLRFQSHDDFEVLVVNGPSTDHTEELLAGYEGRLKHLRCPVANLSMSRNIGIRAAHGDVVAFIDDDAVAEYDWLSELERGYLQPPDGIAIEEIGGVGGVVFDYTGTRFQFRFAISDRHGETEFLDEPPNPAMCVPGGWQYPSLMGTNSSFRRKALAAIGLFDETYEYFLDETDVALRMLDAGYVVLGIDGAPVHHHFLPSHLRNEAKVVTHWYPVVKNRTYFAMRHARGHLPVSDIIRSAIAAGEVRLAESETAEKAGLIAKGSTDRSRGDADRGLLDGIVLGERAGSDRAPAETLNPAPFISFPTMPHTQRLRIGLVSAGYPPRPLAGIARFISELAPALAALGHDVRVFTRATGHPTVEWEDGVWVHRIDDRHSGLVPGAFDYIDDFATGVVREIQRIQPWLPLDCVYGGAWDVETLGVLRATDIPTTIMLATPGREVAQHAGWMTDPALAPGLQALFELERELFGAAHHVHGISHAVVRTIDELYGTPFAEVPVTVAPIGVGDRHTHELRDPQGAPTVLFVGRLEQRKGIDVFLQAVAEVAPLHPSALFQVVGADPAGLGEQWQVGHAGDELADRVVFLGEVDDERLHHLYASAHIVVLPSRYESFGLVVVEAMMHGAAVLSTDIGGIAEVARHGIDAVLVPPADAPALASALNTLLDDSATRARLGEEARRRFLQHFDISTVAPAVVQMLRASIAAHRVG